METQTINQSPISITEYIGRNLLGNARGFFEEYDIDYVSERLNKAFVQILDISKDPEVSEDHKYSMDQLSDLRFSIDAAMKLMLSTYSEINRHTKHLQENK